MDAGMAYRERRGAGVLAVEVSTVRTEDESYWEAVQSCNNGSDLLVRASFGPGGATSSAAWMATRNRGDTLRVTTLYLPYFNLADGVESTDASLVIEVILRERENGERPHQSSIRHEDFHRDSLGRHEVAGNWRKNQGGIPSFILAAGNIDVQKLLAESSTDAVAEQEKGRAPILFLNKGVARHRGPTFPDRIGVGVGLTFNKGSSADPAKRVQSAEGGVPALFVVATTLFDCAIALKKATLSVHAKHGSARNATLLSSGSRGVIVVHESFEWNMTANAGILFVGARNGEAAPNTSPGSLILTLYEGGGRGIRNYHGDQHKEELKSIVGLAEISLEDIVSYGTAGRWCPLRAHSSRQHRSHPEGARARKRSAMVVVGEALVAFAWVNETAALSLPEVVADRSGEKHPRHTGTIKTEAELGVKHRSHESNYGKIKESFVHYPIAGGGEDALPSELLVYVHVWDALLPREHPSSALYMVVRLCRQGSRAQRVSTKPARGRGGKSIAGTNSTTKSWTTLNRAGDAVGSMHVVWDEHLSLVVRNEASDRFDDTSIELRLFDASIDHGGEAAMVACSEVEPFPAFATRHQPTRLKEGEEPPTACCKSPSPFVYRLRSHSHASGGRKEPIAKAKESEFGGVKVRMVCLVLARHDAGRYRDAVNEFLQTKADVAWMPVEELNTVNSVSCVSSTSTIAKPKPGVLSGCRLLDLSAVSGMFQSFADASCGVEQIRETRPASSEHTSDQERRQPSNVASREGLAERNHAGFESTMAKERLTDVAHLYFPGLEQPASFNTGGATLRKAAAFSRAEQRSDSPSHLTFADFVSWLRNFPEEALGAAGLLASPRTVLRKTETTMAQFAEQAQELSDTLRQPEVSTTDVVGFCASSLKSTGKDVALDRIQMGWGEGSEEALERKWRRHTRMLHRDVKVIGKAMAELEEKCFQLAQVQSSIDEPFEGGAVEKFNVVSNAAKPAKEGEPDLALTDVRGAQAGRNYADDEKVTTACELWASKDRLGDSREYVAMLHAGQEVARLGAAAEHLKEVLRCAEDALLRNSERNSGVREGNIMYTYAQTARAVFDNEGSNEDSRGLGVHTQPASDRGDRSADARRHHHHGILMKHIGQVKRFQVEIVALKRRAAVLLPKTEEEFTAWTQRGSKNGRHCRWRKPDIEAPRSALALVKRIRRAREAAHPPSPSKAGCKANENPGEHESDAFVRSPDPVYGESTQGDAETTDGLQDESAAQTPLNNLLHSGEGKAYPPKSNRSTFPAEASYVDQFRRLVAVQGVKHRLEGMQAAFKGSAIGLPAALTGRTAEWVTGVARRSWVGSTDTSPMGSAAAVAMCCPIDRFTLHVFRIAGATESGTEIFKDVQELTGVGGLDTYGSGEALGIMATRAGIVDIDRWVLTAVLRQVIDAVEATEGCARSSYAEDTCTRPMGALVEALPLAAANENDGLSAATEDVADFGTRSEEATFSEQHTPSGGTWKGQQCRHEGAIDANNNDGDGPLPADESEPYKTEASLLWEQVCRDAYCRVMGTVAIILQPSEKYPNPAIPYAYGPSPGETNHTMAIALSGRHEDGVAMARNTDNARQRYFESTSKSYFFDQALLQTLVQASSGSAQAVPTATAGCVKGDAHLVATQADKGLALPVCAEEQLLYTYAMAGFAEGSDLELTDLVEAITARRERESARQPAGCCSLGTTKDTIRLKNICKGKPRAFEQVNNLPPSSGEVEGTWDMEKEDKATKLEISVGVRPALIGIPPELQALFQATAEAQAVRGRLYHQTDRGENPSNDKLDFAEAQVVRVLDGNRTLESAAFSGGKTALHHAAARGDAFLIKLLLERGCKPFLKDFEGKRACELTRDMKCLCLLGALKKAPMPSAHSLRALKAGALPGPEESNASLQKRNPDTVRAMISVSFAVSFWEETIGRVPKIRGPPRSTHDEEDIVGLPDRATKELKEGVARWCDVRNKILYVVEIDNQAETAPKCKSTDVVATTLSTTPTTTTAIRPPMPFPIDRELDDGERRYPDGQETDRRCRGRHVLDVRLLSCLSPRGAGLFNQLEAFSHAWKYDLAREIIHIAIDAAADLGRLCRSVFDGVTAEMVEGVAREAYNDDQLAAKASAAALVTATAAATAAAQKSPTEAAATPAAPLTASNRQHHQPIDWKSEDSEQPRRQSAIESSSKNVSSAKRTADNVIASKKLNFRCTAMITERETFAGSAAVPLSQQTDASLEMMGRERERQGRRYLAELTVDSGVCVIDVRGRSYLTAGTTEKIAGRIASIDLEGRDTGVQSVLDYHGVSLAACVQTFDLMQDMEDPNIVLKMLAAGICQLSTRFVANGVEFSSLDQCGQETLKSDVLGQLSSSANGGIGADRVEWEVLKVTMPAYGGVTSVSISRRDGDGGKASAGKTKELVVSSPAGGWIRPEDAAAALAAPEGSSSLPAMPASAISLVVSLMGCNPCEVVASLRPETGAGGRLALIGNVANDLIGTGSRDRRGGALSELGEGYRGFRCSLEVAWDKDAGGVLVRRFGIERDKKRPRFVLQTVGIRGFSIAQLPVTLEDIDSIWDQADIDEASTSEEGSLQPGAVSTRPTDDAPTLQFPRCSISASSHPSGEDDSAKLAQEAAAGATVLTGGVSESASSDARASLSETECSTNSDDGIPPQATPSRSSTEVPTDVMGVRQRDEREAFKSSPGCSNDYEHGTDPAVRAEIAGEAMPANTTGGKEGDGSSEGAATSTKRVLKEDQDQPMKSREEDKEMGGEKGHEPKKPVQRYSLFATTTDTIRGGSPFVERPEGGEGGGVALQQIPSEPYPTVTRNEDGNKPADAALGENGAECIKRQAYDVSGTSAQSSAVDYAKLTPTANSRSSTTVKALIPHTAAEIRSGADADEAQNTSEVDMEADDMGEEVSSEEKLLIGHLAAGHSKGSAGAGVSNTEEMIPEKRGRKESQVNNDLDPQGNVIGASIATDGTDAVGVATATPNEETAASPEPIAAGDNKAEDIIRRDQRQEEEEIQPPLSQEDEGAGPRTDYGGVDIDDRAVGTPVLAGKGKGEGDNTAVAEDTGFAHRAVTPSGAVVNAQEVEEAPNAIQATHFREPAIEVKAPECDGKGTIDPKLGAQEIADHGVDGSMATGTGNDGDSRESASHSLKEWAFPPSFDALAVLSTEMGAVECVVEGGIALEPRRRSLRKEEEDFRRTSEQGSEHEDEGTPTSATPAATSDASWHSHYCTYKIPAEGNVPQADIDLENDDAQVRLEELFANDYGLTMEKVLGRFSPETDLTSGDAVTQSFARAICQLHPSIEGNKSDQDVEGEGVGFDGVLKAVGMALMGPSEWGEMHVRVGSFRVLTVTIIATCGDEHTSSNGSFRGKVGDDVSHVIANVDCESMTVPRELKVNLTSAGAPVSALEVLERAGFFTGAAVDVGGVLAFLAEETRRADLLGSSSMEAPGERCKTPTVRTGCGRKQVQIFADKRVRTCSVAVTGTAEDVNLEIFSIDSADDGNDVTGNPGIKLSCLRAREGSRSIRSSLRGIPAVKKPDREQPERNASSGDACSKLERPSHIDGAARSVLRRPGEDPGKSEDEVLVVGAKVEGRFGGKGAWFPGVVKAVHDVGIGDMLSELPTLSVVYDDGDMEDDVLRIRVRLPNQKQPRLLNEGDEVDFKRGRQVTLARILRESPVEKGRYDLKILDGKSEMVVENVPRTAMMALHGWPPTVAKPLKQD